MSELSAADPISSAAADGFVMQHFEYEVNIFLPVPPPRLWAAFTLDIDRWWTYRLRDRTRCKIEPFVGGRWTQEWDSGGALFGHFTVYDPPHVLAVTGPLAMTRPAHNVLEFIFDAADTGTRMTVHHEAFGAFDAGTDEIYANGWKDLIGVSLYNFVSPR